MTLATSYPNQLYIDGRWVDPVDGETEAVINPATEEEIAQAPVGSSADLDAALAAARRAVDEGPWATMSLRERSERLRVFAQHLDDRKEEIAEVLIQEAGAIRSFVLPGHVLTGLKFLHFSAEFAARDLTKATPVTVTPGAGGTKNLGASVLLREPVGVIAAITAFNFPFHLNCQKVGPALAMGNSVVLKPSPFTPLTALIMGQAAEAADLPPGVFNVVTGGPETGAMLTTDPRVDLISFTGSDAVGAKIMAQAAPSLKRVHFELGGKSALIVRADADLDAAVATAHVEVTRQSGQGCVSCMRHLVHNSLKDEFVARLGERMAAMKLGDPSDPTTQMGPLIREAQRARVQRFVDGGLADNAKLVTGGKRPEHLDKGFFFEPTLFTDVDNGTELAQQEIFGPVAAVMGFDTDEEAVRIANASIYGLSGQIWSRDVGTAYLMAQKLKTGQVMLNGGNLTANPWDPFGGIRRSGIGREMGEEGFYDFTNLKTIRFHAG